jgi:hypothetical protein
MTNASLFRRGWIHAKDYGPGVLAAALIFAGISQILGALQYPLNNYAVQFVNLMLRQAFRDVMPLAERGAIPWIFHAKIVAEGVIIAVVGMFIGLWVHARSRRQPAR